MAESWRASASIESLRQRAQVYRYIRQFFEDRGVMEVETPILSEAGNTDPNIESFHLQFTGSNLAGSARRWLRTSPEFALKRLLASGIGDCYELGRVFRNGEFGHKHNPEFTMLEWYRLGWNHHQLIHECVEMVLGLFLHYQVSLSVQHYTYQALFQDYLDVNPHRCTDSELCSLLQSKVNVDVNGLLRDDWFNLLMTHVIEPQLPATQLTVLYDFPASQCALAKISHVYDVPVAERFELYLGAHELANGYHELTDAAEQRKRFKHDLLVRAQNGSTIPDMDERLIQSLDYLPNCAGVAMGIDRLMMVLLQNESIEDVIAFGFNRS